MKPLLRTTPAPISVSTLEDTPYSFAAADFNFADVDDGDSLAAVRLDSLPDTGSLTLAGTAVTTAQEITAAEIPSLVYTPAANATGTVSFTYSVGDGTSYSAAPATATVTVTPVNDAPVVTLTATPLAFTEGDAPLVIDDGLTVTDVDSTTLSSAVIQIASGRQDGDNLAFVNDGTSMGNIAAAGYDALTGQLALSSESDTATLAQWQAALRAVTYQTLSDNPGDTARSLTVTVNDGTRDSNSGTRSLTVTQNDIPSGAGTTASANTPPTISGTPETTVAEDTAYSFTPTGADDDGDTLVYAINKTPSWASFDTGTGALTGTPSNADVGTTTEGIVISVTDNIIAMPVPLAAFTLEVTNVNDAPTSRGATVSIAEDSVHTFAAAEFNFADVDAGDSLVSLRIDTLPTSGRLSLGDTAVIDGLVIAVADIPSLVYTPVANTNGNFTFTFSVNDGTVFSAAPAMATVTVISINDVPTSSGAAVSTAENTALTFAAADFNFADADSLAALRIDTLPDSGRLTLKGAAVAVSDEIAVFAIPNLVYTPAPDTAGAVTFGYSVSDGTDFSANPVTITVTVTAVNEPDTACFDWLTFSQYAGLDFMDFSVREDGLELQLAAAASTSTSVGPADDLRIDSGEGDTVFLQNLAEDYLAAALYNYTFDLI